MCLQTPKLGLQQHILLDFEYMFLSADGRPEVEEKEELQWTTEDDQFGPKCYYDKAKSFFDNISSDQKLR